MNPTTNSPECAMDAPVYRLASPDSQIVAAGLSREPYLAAREHDVTRNAIDHLRRRSGSEHVVAASHDFILRLLATAGKENSERWSDKRKTKHANTSMIADHHRSLPQEEGSARRNDT